MSCFQSQSCHGSSPFSTYSDTKLHQRRFGRTQAARLELHAHIHCTVLSMNSWPQGAKIRLVVSLEQTNRITTCNTRPQHSARARQQYIVKSQAPHRYAKSRTKLELGSRYTRLESGWSVMCSANCQGLQSYILLPETSASYQYAYTV